MAWAVDFEDMLADFDSDPNSSAPTAMPSAPTPMSWDSRTQSPQDTLDKPPGNPLRHDKQAMADQRRQRRPRPQTTCSSCHNRKIKCNQRKPCDQCVRHRRENECTYPHGHPLARATHARLDLSEPDSAARRSTSSSAASARLVPHLGSTPADTRNTDESSSSTKDLVHTWTEDHPIRGRSHYSWLLQHFSPLLSFVEGHGDASKDRARLMSAESGAYDERIASITPRQEHDRFAAHHQGHVPTSWGDELPQRPIADMLYERYFQTFNTVCPILHRPTFETHYHAMMTDIRNVKICFVIEVLMVLALGNATLAVDEQVISPETGLNWLDLASSGPSTAMDLREFDIDSVRMWALINYARQLLKFDIVADYVYTGSALRSGMLIGLHRPSEWAKGGNRRGLWEALVGLDLQACLSSGSPPSAASISVEDQMMASGSPNIVDDGSSPDCNVSDIRLGRALSQSLAVRYKIAHLLNVEKNASFDTAMELGRELTRIMAPSALADDLPFADQPFQLRYVSFIYKSFLAALHRPFASLQSHVFHYSRTVAISLAQQHVEAVVAALEGNIAPGYFDLMLRGPGSLLTVEIYNAVMFLCLQLYNTTTEELAMDAVLSTGIDNRTLAYGTVKRFLTLHEENHTLRRNPFPHPYIAASLTLAHFEAVRQTDPQIVEYGRYMSKRAEKIAQGLLVRS